MEIDFKEIIKGKIVFVGIGNTLKGDDGCGPVFIEKIKGKVKAVCIDAGATPENYTGKIIKEKPDTIILIDAVHLDKKPGEYEIVQKSDIEKHGFTTHDISPNIVIEYLEKETNAQIYMIGIQPLSLNLGEPVSEPVVQAINEITRLIEEIFEKLKADTR